MFDQFYIIFMVDRCTREQQREKIVDLMNLRGQLEKMAKELNQEVAAKKNAEESCKKVFKMNAERSEVW